VESQQSSRNDCSNLSECQVASCTKMINRIGEAADWSICGARSVRPASRFARNRPRDYALMKSRGESALVFVARLNISRVSLRASSLPWRHARTLRTARYEFATQCRPGYPNSVLATIAAGNKIDIFISTRGDLERGRAAFATRRHGEGRLLRWVT